MTVRVSNSGFIFVDPASPLENIGWTLTLLAETDYATILAQVERYLEMNYSAEYNDVGGGSVKLSLDDSIFTDVLPAGQTTPIREQEGLWQVYHDGVLRGAFFAEDVKETTLDKDNSDRVVEIAGRGVGSCLDRAIVMPLGMPTPTSLTRSFTGSAIAAWLTLLNEAKARGTLTYVNPQFSSTLDSAGNAWIDNTKFNVGSGDNLLDLLQKWCDAIGKRWYMTPDFSLYIYPEEGNHRESQVALTVYSDQESSERTTTRREIANYIAAQGGDKSVAVASSSTSQAKWGRREQWLQAGTADDVSMAQQIANATAKLNNDQKTQRSYKVQFDVEGGLVFQNYTVGDWVGVEVQDYSADVGFVDSKHVAAISVKVDQENTTDLEVTFESKFDVRARRLQRLIDKLGGSTVGGTSTQGSPIIVASATDLGNTKLSGLADVDPTGLTIGQTVSWNGTKWVPTSFPTPGVTPIRRGSAIVASHASSASVAIPLPAGIQVGDFGIIMAAQGSAGWTAMSNNWLSAIVDNGTNLSLVITTKVIDATDVSTGTVTSTYSTAATGTYAVVVYQSGTAYPAIDLDYKLDRSTTNTLLRSHFPAVGPGSELLSWLSTRGANSASITGAVGTLEANVGDANGRSTLYKQVPSSSTPTRGFQLRITSATAAYMATVGVVVSSP